MLLYAFEESDEHEQVRGRSVPPIRVVGGSLMLELVVVVIVVGPPPLAKAKAIGDEGAVKRGLPYVTSLSPQRTNETQ